MSDRRSEGVQSCPDTFGMMAGSHRWANACKQRWEGEWTMKLTVNEIGQASLRCHGHRWLGSKARPPVARLHADPAAGALHDTWFPC